MRQRRRKSEAAEPAFHVARVAPVHAPGVRGRSTLVEPSKLVVSARKNGAQAGSGGREIGSKTGHKDRKTGELEKMNPRNFPTGRPSPDKEDEVIINIMSMDGPEEAGPNARSPSPTPNYEEIEDAEVFLEEAEAEKDKARSPVYEAPVSRSPSREKSPIRPVLYAYYTQNFRPKQV